MFEFTNFKMTSLLSAPWDSLIIILACLAGFVNLLYYLFFYAQFKKEQSKELAKLKTYPGVSLVVCSRNGLLLLKDNLPKWVNQVYPDYEVIVVNDGSEDGTTEWLSQMLDQIPNLKILNIPPAEKINLGKKSALTQGISIAQKPWILLTDDDCAPVSEYWIAQIMNHSTQNTSVIIGISPLLSGETLASKFASLESVLTCMQYASWTAAGQPYMAVGRNLAYRKEAFYQADGFSKHSDILSGDDDLFIQSAKSHHLKIVVSNDAKSFTISAPPLSFKDYFRQKSRHVSTSVHYDVFSKFQLAIFAGSHLIFYLGIVFLIMTSYFFLIPILVGLRWLLIRPSWNVWYRHLFKETLGLGFIGFDIFLTYYYSRLIKGVIIKNKHW